MRVCILLQPNPPRRLAVCEDEGNLKIKSMKDNRLGFGLLVLMFSICATSARSGYWAYDNTGYFSLSGFTLFSYNNDLIVGSIVNNPNDGIVSGMPDPADWVITYIDLGEANPYSAPNPDVWYANVIVIIEKDGWTIETRGLYFSANNGNSWSTYGFPPAELIISSP